MSSSVEALLVWKHPLRRDRYVIGRLARDQQGYTYQNQLEGPYSLPEAQASGFTALDLFGESDQVHRSDTLFPLFARRLPPEWRREEYARLGLTEDQDVEFLVKTGGRMAGDTFEFLEAMPPEAEIRELELDFPVAGWRYYDGERAVAELAPGTPLKLELETDNEFDKSAIKIHSPSGHLLGYVPRIYSWYFDDCIEEHRYHAEVKELGPQENPQLRMIVRFKLTASDARLRRVPMGLEALTLA